MSEPDLLRIYDLATHQNQTNIQQPLQYKKDSCYSNGEFGNQWSVRQITDISFDSEEEILKYKVVAGSGRIKKGAANLSSSC